MFLKIVLVVGIILAGAGANTASSGDRPHRIVMDTDVDMDDVFALLYLLKLNPSQFDLQAVTINTNAWTNAGHAVNHIYDILYMMGRDDVAVGVGGEGGILENGTILPDVGGYLPIIQQGKNTAGYCRYRQAIPAGSGGRLGFDTNFGLRKSFLPQGSRKYVPLQQATAQQVLIDKISAGPTTIIILGAHTNFAIFLMNNPHLKKNVEHIFVMGGSIRSKSPGNLFKYKGKNTNPYAEFNMFADPFAAYQVIHSGIPVTLVPLDATNTIPASKNFFDTHEQKQFTYEAQYCFKSLKIARDTWFDDQFYTKYFLWDTFTTGVAASIMNNSYNQNGENEFAEMEYMNITVITSNEPYGISDGSNPFSDGHKIPKFNLRKDGVHSGHVQTGIRDPFCLANENGTDVGRCKDGYTAEVSGGGGVRVLVATKAKPSRDKGNSLDREFYSSFLNVLNDPKHCGRFNFTTQFPYYKQVLYKPDFTGKRMGKNLVFDMDMSAGDFLALFYLLKVPVETINLKAILVTATGWANAATIDVVYDLLHMMGRDDIPIGLGGLFAVNQSNDNNFGDCKYSKAIPNGGGGFLDSDTLYGLARNLPRSPRGYTAENSIKYGAPRDTDHPELRQPLAMEVWESLLKSLDSESKISILTNGPLTNLAKIITSNKSISSLIQDVYIVGGHIHYDKGGKGNVINIPNEYAELDMFLDPLAAELIFQSELNITLIPLRIQRKVSSFPLILERLRVTRKTPESLFALRFLSELQRLKQTHPSYQHMETFLGEILGAVNLADDNPTLKSTYKVEVVEAYATGAESTDGELNIDEKRGKPVRILQGLDTFAYYELFAKRLGDEKQSAVVGTFEEQIRIWSRPPNITETIY